MYPTQTKTFFTTLLLSFSLNFASIPSPPTNHLIEKTCKKTDHFYSPCVQILASDPKIVSATSDMKLASVSLDFIAKDTKANKDRLVGFFRDKATKEAGTICVDWFQMAAREFEVSLKEISEDPMSANYDAALADSGQSGRCEKALVKDGIREQDILGIVERMKCLCRIAYAVTDNVMLVDVKT